MILIASAVPLITLITVSLSFSATERRVTVPSRLTPNFLPVMSSGFLISAFTMTDCVKRGTMAVMCMMSPPCKIYDITDGPPDPAKSAAPDNIALKSADEAPTKTGSNSMPCLSKIRASLATNQGRQLTPMGENGKGTLFNACAHSGFGRKSAATRIRASLLPALKDRSEDGKSREPFISDPPFFAAFAGLIHSDHSCQRDAVMPLAVMVTACILTRPSDAL